MGLLTWESKFSTQVWHLIQVADEMKSRHDYNVWELAGVPDPEAAMTRSRLCTLSSRTRTTG
jgi:hypothetical protein